MRRAPSKEITQLLHKAMQGGLTVDRLGSGHYRIQGRGGLWVISGTATGKNASQRNQSRIARLIAAEQDHAPPSAKIHP